ncbi:hypothetical protein LTR84_004811 [Exophiala bonariae]|uniref:Transcription factor CBF/NF-Y/archaeal histone domain-containing protein n=1 Tax=Exophiala bonariae TaxID=1690606 RepID=A0AAV9NNE9_9EURO|nr:hypothetical protein LTR84_004811 [Exophiala bonariae]
MSKAGVSSNGTDKCDLDEVGEERISTLIPIVDRVTRIEVMERFELDVNKRDAIERMAIEYLGALSSQLGFCHQGNADDAIKLQYAHI